MNVTSGHAVTPSTHRPARPRSGCRTSEPNSSASSRSGALSATKTSLTPKRTCCPTSRVFIRMLSVFGKHLRVIDFSDNSHLTCRGIQDVRSVFDQCPNLHTLSYNIKNTILPHADAVLHPSLGVIMLRVDPIAQDDDGVLERCLRMHITTLTGGAFPALHRVVLQFDERWDRSVFSPSYLMMRQPPRKRRWAIEHGSASHQRLVVVQGTPFAALYGLIVQDDHCALRSVVSISFGKDGAIAVIIHQPPPSVKSFK